MVLHPHGIKPIPSLTKEIARKAFPNGNLYMSLRDKLGTYYDDEDSVNFVIYVLVLKLNLEKSTLDPKTNI
jgi:hypothetical protein